MMRIRLTVPVVLCAILLCACSVTPFGKSPESSASEETGTETTAVQTKDKDDTPEYSELIRESVPEETEPVKPLTDEEAMTGFTNYLYFKIKNLQTILDEDKLPCTWGIASSNKDEIMIMFKSHTGALLRYHVNRNTGKTYVTQYAVQTNSYYRTKETLNVREYIDKKPTPTPYAIKPSNSKAATAAPKPKVKVSNAVSKTVSISGHKYSYKIPKVSITGKNTNAANKKIKSQLSKYSYKGSNAREIVYSYHVTGKLVSILVRISDHKANSFPVYMAYNIAISSGNLVKDRDVVRLSGKTDKQFYSMLKDTFKNYKGGSSVPAADAKKIINTNLKRVSYQYADPYIGKNGHLCFVAYVACYGGKGAAYKPFDAVTHKPI